MSFAFLLPQKLINPDETYAACNTTPQVYSTATSTTYNVPADCDTLTIKAWGAGGGGGGESGGVGGGGGFAQGDVTVTPSETLNIVVGGGGDDTANVCVTENNNSGHGGGGDAITDGGGGKGGCGNEGAAGSGGGGGGMASVQRDSDSTYLIIAGGGGGGGGGGSGGAGGGGGGTTGQTGGDGGASSPGGGGQAGSGGTAGTSAGAPTVNGQAGDSLIGGNGGSGTDDFSRGGGGGGGGLYGGGGGGGQNDGVQTSGGGGGSGKVTGTTTTLTAATGQDAANNLDGDYANNAGRGGNSATNGNPGRIVIIPSASADTTAPTPDPMTFATAPDDASTTSISMTSNTGSDPSTPVEYLFTYTACGADAGTGGTSSSWQTSTSYTDTGLQVNKCYGYTVTARDSVPNTGTASSSSEAYTAAAVPGTPTLNAATSSTLDLTNAENSNPSANPTTSFAVQVVTTTPNDATWLNQWVDGSGNPSATAVWLTDAQLDSLTLQGLTASTTYGVKVKARNGDSDETALSAEGQGATSAANAGPGTPTLSETPAFPNIDTADTTPVLGNFSATDPDSDAIEYEIQWDEDFNFGTPVTQNSSGFASNGFTAATFASGASVSYTVQGGEALTNGQTYWWRVRGRDPSGANTWSSYSSKRSITIDTSISLDQWLQTTTEQFDSANGNTLTDTQATGNGVKLNGW